jgi:hypothetical protein
MTRADALNPVGEVGSLGVVHWKEPVAHVVLVAQTGGAERFGFPVRVTAKCHGLVEELAVVLGQEHLAGTFQIACLAAFASQGLPPRFASRHRPQFE